MNEEIYKLSVFEQNNKGKGLWIAGGTTGDFAGLGWFLLCSSVSIIFFSFDPRRLDAERREKKKSRGR